MIYAKQGRALILLLGAALSSACASLQPISAGQPKRGPTYPVLVTANEQRLQTVLAAWNRILSSQQIGGKPDVPLEPVTATIRNLPSNLGGSLYLPKVGAGPQMTDEETIESLRRFLTDWQVLLGATAPELSLLQLETDSTGVRTAVYEHRPFSYPLRGGYGKVQIRFTADRRVVDVFSLAVPDASKIQSAINSVTPSLKSEAVAQHVAGQALNYNDSAGSPRVYSISADSQISVQQLVVYARFPPDAETLEFRLAWEVNLANAPVKTIYVDAVKDEIIAAS